MAVTILSTVLAAALLYSAARKLTHDEVVVRSYAAAGVPEDRLNALALVLVAGAAGLLVGLAWEPLGIAAAACLVAYFAVACAFHVRNGDAAHVGMPLALAVAAAAVLVATVA